MSMPSEEQIEALGNIILKATIEELEGLAWSRDMPAKERIRRILKAFKVARDIADKHNDIWVDVPETVATAFWYVGNALDLDIQEISPNSLAGGAIIDFVCAVSALNSISDADALLRDGGEALIGDRYADSALLLQDN